MRKNVSFDLFKFFFLTVNCPMANCPTANCPTANCPTANCPRAVFEISTPPKFTIRVKLLSAQVFHVQNSNFDTRLTAFNRYRRDLSNELGFNIVELDLDGLLA